MNHSEREVGLDYLGTVIEERLQNGQQVQMTVVGNSMFPLFRNKLDSVILSPIQKRIKKGDVVLYKRTNGQYVLHRIIRYKKGVYSANGDNQYWIETPLFSEQFLGLMTGFHRKNKLYSTSALWYRIYSFVWVVARPLRGFILKILIKIRTWVKHFEKK
ncbi:MAG: peptidase S24 [Ruminococcaceae bacterium]|nr:peptidase S24 [Oscillospiraceae bacterium]